VCENPYLEGLQRNGEGGRGPVKALAERKFFIWVDNKTVELISYRGFVYGS